MDTAHFALEPDPPQPRLAGQRPVPPQQPTAPRRARPPDTEQVRAADPEDSHPDRESRYRPEPAGAQQKPPNVRIELRLVDGPEGKKLRARQAAVIREALRWFAEHGDREQTRPDQPGPAEE